MASSCSCQGLLQPNFSKGFQPLGSHRLHYHPTTSNLKNGGSFLGDSNLKYIQTLRTNKGSKSCQGLLQPNFSKGFQPLGSHRLHYHPTPSNLKNGGSFLGDSNLKYIQTLRTNKGSKRKELVGEATPDPEVANHLLSFWPSDNPWFAGFAGFMVTVPFLAQRLLSLTKEVDLAAQTVEKIADAVEKVAEEVDKAAENIAESLPEGALKNVVHLVEDLAEETAKDAQKVEDLMDKIEEIDDKVEAYFSNNLNSKDNPSI